jgi:hypothetical protein
MIRGTCSQKMSFCFQVILIRCIFQRTEYSLKALYYEQMIRVLRFVTFSPSTEACTNWVTFQQLSACKKKAFIFQSDLNQGVGWSLTISSLYSAAFRQLGFTQTSKWIENVLIQKIQIFFPSFECKPISPSSFKDNQPSHTRDEIVTGQNFRTSVSLGKQHGLFTYNFV